MATHLPLGMRTEVEVEMAALRPGSEGFFNNYLLPRIAVLSQHMMPQQRACCGWHTRGQRPHPMAALWCRMADTLFSLRFASRVAVFA